MSDTIGAWWNKGASILEKAGIEGARRDAQIILAHHLGVKPGRLSVMAQDPLPAMCKGVGFQRSYHEDLDARVAGRPVAKIIGRKAFWKADFYVNDHVLDPRPETEVLVAAALEHPFKRVLDLGTGSGAILISLLLERPEAMGVGTDTSAEAVLVAGKNAERLGVADRILLPMSDWWDDVGSHYDLIVSNPPYIALDEMEGLAAELAFDPREALTDEADGLSCYRTICAGAPDHLTPGGWLMVEIGPTQGEAVVSMMGAAGLNNAQIRTDLDGRDRVVMGQMPQ